MQDTQKGAALFAEARKAIGGDDKLRAVKTLQSKGTYKRTAGTNTRRRRRDSDRAAGQVSPQRVERLCRRADQERIEVLNGEEVWGVNAAGGFGGSAGGGGGGDFGGRRGDRGGFGGQPAHSARRAAAQQAQGAAPSTPSG